MTGLTENLPHRAQAVIQLIRRRSRKEVVTTIKILRRRDVHAPVGDCWRSCLKEMRAMLAELGVQDGVWQPAEVAAS
jgi:hypothetical protein